MTNWKIHNYIYNIDDKKSLANGIRKYEAEKTFWYLIVFNLITNLSLYSNYLVYNIKSSLIILILLDHNYFY